MVLRVLASNAKKCPIVFVPHGEWVIVKSYQVLQYIAGHGCLPCILRAITYSSRTAHSAVSMQQFLEFNMGAYWWKVVRPPFLPDLNPLVYSLWLSGRQR
jgi:hypothetical protein